MKLRYIAMALFAMLSGAQGAMADGLAVGAKAGTLGAGVELTTNIVPMLLNGRLQLNGFKYNTTVTDTNVHYDAKLKLFSVGALADVYPFAGKFRLTAGAYYNGNKLDITGVPTAASYNFNGTTYTSAQAGTVTGTMDFNNFAPYAGIGWGDAVSSGSPIGFNVDLGVLYQGKPKTSITATGAAAGLAADIAAEQTRLDNSVKNFKFYPVASVGVSWNF
ncbi:MAG: hypothetical protein Q9M30_06015 [Mariprofundaceae bacterium]|nr:hypothetical protein [Mariprofundaceae bacterium]